MRTEKIEQLENKITELSKTLEKTNSQLEEINTQYQTLPLKELEKRKDIHEKYNKLYTQKQDITELLAMYRHNWECATLAEVLPIVCDIISKYNGKQAGEKTKEKISNEIRTATGFSGHISTYINGGYIVLNLSKVNGIYNRKDIYTRYGVNIIDGNNTIHAITFDDLHDYTSKYIGNPEQAQHDRKATAQKIKELKSQIEELAEEYNNTSVNGLTRYYINLDERR